jgi:glutamyl-tRNA reductase
MYIEEKKLLTDFWAIGISYHKSDTALRGNYAINENQYSSILEIAPLQGVHELFVLSTCNRTEIYGFAKCPDDLIKLLCNNTVGSEQDFYRNAYIKNGNEAIHHIYNIAAGLDSQILGDYEIVGQMKQAIQVAKNHNKIGWFIDRLFKSALQSSREIRSRTELSTGTVSVAFAAVKFITNHLGEKNDSRIAVIGAGSIGRTTCLNLLQHYTLHQIYIANRTEETAIQLADGLGLQVLPYQKVKESLDQFDAIVVATNARNYILGKNDFSPDAKIILVDLAMPQNIDPAVLFNKNITLANVDDLSKVNDETFRKRSAEIPKVNAIIGYHFHDFMEWYSMRQNVPIIKSVKEKLHKLNVLLFDTDKDNCDVQKALNSMVLQLKEDEDFKPGCCYIETMHKYISESVSTN